MVYVLLPSMAVSVKLVPEPLTLPPPLCVTSKVKSDVLRPESPFTAISKSNCVARSPSFSTVNVTSPEAEGYASSVPLSLFMVKLLVSTVTGLRRVTAVVLAVAVVLSYTANVPAEVTTTAAAVARESQVVFLNMIRSPFRLLFLYCFLQWLSYHMSKILKNTCFSISSHIKIDMAFSNLNLL